MNQIIERIKRIPVPIWIGLALVILLLMIMGGRKRATAGPVTDATVGAQGVQPGAGTDQQLGNLSQTFQTGFNDLRKHEQANSEAMANLQSGYQTGFTQTAQLEQGNQNLLQQILAAMQGHTSSFTGMGSAIQQTQNQAAAANASNTMSGQGVATYNPPSTQLYNVPIMGPGGSGAGTIQVVANNPQAAYQNAYQGGNTPTGPATPV
jgi:hypothetical protein